MSKVYPALNERIAEALTDGFNFSESILKELSATINRVIEDYSKEGLPFVKAELQQQSGEPAETPEPELKEYEIHLACDNKDEFYTKLLTLIPEDLFEKTRISQPPVPASPLSPKATQVQAEPGEKVINLEQIKTISIETQKEVINRLTAENKQQTSRIEELEKLGPVVTRAEIEELEAKLKVAHGYIRARNTGHLLCCDSGPGGHAGKCDCGLEQALKAI